jgi:hypothetical protein
VSNNVPDRTQPFDRRRVNGFDGGSNFWLADGEIVEHDDVTRP